MLWSPLSGDNKVYTCRCFEKPKLKNNAAFRLLKQIHNQINLFTALRKNLPSKCYAKVTKCLSYYNLR